MAVGSFFKVTDPLGYFCFAESSSGRSRGGLRCPRTAPLTPEMFSLTRFTLPPSTQKCRISYVAIRGIYLYSGTVGTEMDTWVMTLRGGLRRPDGYLGGGGFGGAFFSCFFALPFTLIFALIQFRFLLPLNL